MKMRNHLLGLAVLGVLAAAPDTASAQVPYAHLEGGRAEQEEGKPAVTRVSVRNHNYLDVNVYVWSGAQRVRLGSVSGLTTRALKIPSHLVFGVTDLQFELDPIGSPSRPFTNEVAVGRGDEVVVTVPTYGM